MKMEIFTQQLLFASLHGIFSLRIVISQLFQGIAF